MRHAQASQANKSNAGGDKMPSTGSRLRLLRKQRGFSQEELAARANMHRNSVYKLEVGTTSEVTEEHADALAAALRVTPAELGLKIRAALAPPRSVRFRQLSPDQRQLVDELMTFPPEDYAAIRAALQHVRNAKQKKKKVGQK